MPVQHLAQTTPPDPGLDTVVESLRSMGESTLALLDVSTNAITVKTANDVIRSSFVTGVGYDSDLDEVRDLTLARVAATDGVLDEPAPQAYFTEHGSSAVVLDVRYWTGSRQAEVRRVQDRVVQVLFDAYNEAGIDMPFDVLTLDADERFGQVLGPAIQGEAPARAAPETP